MNPKFIIQPSETWQIKLTEPTYVFEFSWEPNVMKFLNFTHTHKLNIGHISRKWQISIERIYLKQKYYEKKRSTKLNKSQRTHGIL